MTTHPKDIALLGLDIGTTRCKLTCYTPGGERIAQASAAYAVSHPAPGRAELDPDDIIGAVTQVLSEAVPHLAGFRRLALATSAQGEAFVLVDGEGQALAPAPVSMDMRGLSAIEGLKADPAASKAAGQAGQELNPLTSLAKLLWFRDSPDRLLERTDQVLCVGEFVLLRMGLRPVMDHSMAARTGLLDVRSRTWSQGLLTASGLSPDLFPPVTPAGQYVGSAAADRLGVTGLSQKIEIYTGGHDQACAMLGAGVTGTEIALYSIGTTEAIGLPVQALAEGLEDLHILPYPHVVAESFVLLFGSQHGGRVLPWLAALVGRKGASLVPDNITAGPSALTIVPHLAGSGTVLADERSKGTLYGLDYDTTPESLILATLEGVTMEQALGLSRLAAKGYRVSGLRAVGGGTRSDVWMQLKADVIGLPIDCLEEPDTACAGAAVLAGLGAGVFASAEEAAARFVRTRRRFEPRPRFQEVYALKRTLYEQTYYATAGLEPLRQEVEVALARANGGTKGRH